jgi:hypothetical protein
VAVLTALALDTADTELAFVDELWLREKVLDCPLLARDSLLEALMPFLLLGLAMVCGSEHRRWKQDTTRERRDEGRRE